MHKKDTIQPSTTRYNTQASTRDLNKQPELLQSLLLQCRHNVVHHADEAVEGSAARVCCSSLPQPSPRACSQHATQRPKVRSDHVFQP